MNKVKKRTLRLISKETKKGTKRHYNKAWGMSMLRRKNYKFPFMMEPGPLLNVGSTEETKEETT